MSTDVVRAATDALSRRDFDALRELLDEDVVWHATGDERVAGTYRGREEVLEALRRSAARGPSELLELTEIEDPAEVSGFALREDPAGGGFTRFCRSLVGSDCGAGDVGGNQTSTQADMLVSAGRISQLGSITGGLGFKV